MKSGIHRMAIARTESHEKSIDDCVRIDWACEQACKTRQGGDVVLDLGQVVVRRFRQRLYEEAACAYINHLGTECHAQTHRRRGLFALRQVEGEIAGDLARDEWNRPRVGRSPTWPMPHDIQGAESQCPCNVR